MDAFFLREPPAEVHPVCVEGTALAGTVLRWNGQTVRTHLPSTELESPDLKHGARYLSLILAAHTAYERLCQLAVTHPAHFDLVPRPVPEYAGVQMYRGYDPIWESPFHSGREDDPLWASPFTDWTPQSEVTDSGIGWFAPDTPDDIPFGTLYLTANLQNRQREQPPAWSLAQVGIRGAITTIAWDDVPAMRAAARRVHEETAEYTLAMRALAGESAELARALRGQREAAHLIAARRDFATTPLARKALRPRISGAVKSVIDDPSGAQVARTYHELNRIWDADGMGIWPIGKEPHALLAAVTLTPQDPTVVPKLAEQITHDLSEFLVYRDATRVWITADDTAFHAHASLFGVTDPATLTRCEAR